MKPEDYAKHHHTLVEQYVTDILDKNILSNDYVYNAVQRYRDDLNRDDLVYNVDAITKVFKFFSFLDSKVDNKYVQFNLLPFQAFIIANLYGFFWVSTGRRRFRYSYLEMARKSGKALSLDTRIPTPNGWTTMVNVNVGDIVFDELGNRTTVTHTTPIQLNRDCYNVTFEDGESIIADANHQWEVMTKTTRKRNQGREGWLTKTTKQLLDSGLYHKRSDGKGTEYKYRVPQSKALELPKKDLIIDPYLLGCWLGDGTSVYPRFTVSVDDLGMYDFLKDSEYHYRVLDDKFCKTVTLAVPRNKKRSDYRGFLYELRQFDLVGNKHIPLIYLRASKDQRLSLLQGLMDTDGSVDKSGKCEFIQKSNKISNGIGELLSSLGIKYVTRKKMSKIDGKECGLVNRITFFTDKTLPCFRLGRKYNRLKDKLSDRMTRKTIRCITPVDSVPVKCISVDSPNSLYLAGDRMTVTHNTFFSTGLSLYHLVADGENDAEVLFLATTREQASIALRYVKSIVHNSFVLTDRVDVMQYQLRFEHQTKESKSSTSILKTLPSNADRLDGYSPSFVLIDEYHAHPDAEILKVMKSGILARDNPLISIITTAGFDLDKPCFQYREGAINVLRGEVVADDLFTMIFTLDSEDDFTDSSLWIKANPALGSISKIEDLESEFNQASITPSLLNNFLTKNLNMWVSNESAWIDEKVLEKTFEEKVNIEDYKGKDCYIGLDLSSTRDLTSAVLLFEDDGQFVSFPFFFMANNPSKKIRKGGINLGVWIRNKNIIECQTKTIDYELLEDYFNIWVNDFNVVAVGYDYMNSALIIPKVEALGIDCIKVPQSASAFNFPLKYLEKLMYDENIVIDNPVMKWNFRNVVLYTDGNENIKVMKNKSKDAVDGVVSLAQALSMWLQINHSPERVAYEGYLSSSKEEQKE